MSELLEIIISAVDQASDVFSSISDTVSGSADEIQAQFEQATSEVERLTDELAAIYMGDIEGDAEAVESALAAAEAEAERLGEAMNNVEEESNEAGESIDAMADLMSFQQISEWVTQLADAMWQVADKAGTVQDSWTRMGLAAEGANVPVEDMKNSVTSLSSETGRAGGQIREAFIEMTGAGIESLDTMENLFKGASAQAFIHGTSVDALANKYTGMAMKSSIAERTLKGTGITIQDLGDAMGMQGATLDEINAKWETLTTDQRANILGSAALMDEGKSANDEYKDSWEGLQAQIDIAKGKLEVLAGKVFLPVLIPAMEAAARVLDWLGNTIGAVMDGPLGGFISVLGSLGGGLVLLLGGITAISAGMGFFTASLWPAITASWALLTPWLPWIALGAAIVAVIYEIGKAFGWWTDASSMLDAISAGLQRLWDAFINHPDVQAAISAISTALSTLWSWITQAGQAVLEFFNINTGGEFDIVHEIILGLGRAWEALSFPIRLVITVVQAVINAFQMVIAKAMEIQAQLAPIWNGISSAIWPYVSQIIGFVRGLMDIFNQFRSGQMDLPTFIMTVLTQLWTAYNTILIRIGSAVLKFAGQLLNYGRRAARNLMNSIINTLRSLPGRVYSALSAVVGRIRSAIQSWINTAKTKVHSLISNITSPFSGVAGKISSALNGVVDAITSPFQSAWNTIEPIVNNIKGAMDTIGNALNFSAGYEYLPADVNAAGYDLGNQYIVESGNQSVDVNQNITLDLANVPAHIDTDTLISALTDRRVLRSIADSGSFQEYDLRAKQRFAGRRSRSGV